MSSSFSNRHGAERNINGGLFIRGQAYNILTKLQVADEYKAAAASVGSQSLLLQRSKENCLHTMGACFHLKRYGLTQIAKGDLVHIP